MTSQQDGGGKERAVELRKQLVSSLLLLAILISALAIFSPFSIKECAPGGIKSIKPGCESS